MNCKLFCPKRWMLLISIAVLIFLISTSRLYATFFGEVKTGLQNIPVDQYGYSLYVPENYTQDRSWPLIVALHDEGGKGEDYIQSWLDEAKKRGAIIFCPTYPIPRDLPYDSDRRILKLLKTVRMQYEIDSNRILVTGSGFGGHYATFLAFQHPSHFSAAASLGNGLDGIFSKVFKYPYATKDRLPILVAITSDSNKAGIEKARSKGVSVDVVTVENVAGLAGPEIRSSIMDWFDKMVQEGKVPGKNKTGGFKDKLLGLWDRAEEAEPVFKT